MRKIFVSVIVLAVFIGALSAVPYTTMGMLRVPDAYVLPNKAAEFSFTNYFRQEKEESGKYDYIPMGMINVGVLNRLQIGGWIGDEVVFANLKLKIIEETLAIPQVSVGVDNLFSPLKEDARILPADDDFADNPDRVFYEKNSPYVCFSKATIVRGLPGIPIMETILTLGWGRNKFRGQAPLAHKFEGLFGSLSFTPMKNFSVIGEVDGFNINIGAQYNYQNFALKVGYVGLEENQSRVGVGLSYLFDKYADARKRPVLFLEEGVPSTAKGTKETIGAPTTGTAFSTNELLEELRRLRQQREQAQKVLEELRNQLKQMEEESSTGL